VKKFKYILIVFLYLFSVNTLHAKADTYLATGVLTSERKTEKALGKLKAELEISNPEVYKSQEFKAAYNTSHGLWDFIEAGAQLLGQNGWGKFWSAFVDFSQNALTGHFIDYFTNIKGDHKSDLSEQIKNYKKSINAGNQVIVIAHSQGNYFTNEAYKALSECQKKSFYMLGVANPASSVSGMSEGRGKLVTLDNDPITYVPSSMSPNIINGERFIIGGIDFSHYKFHFFDYYRSGKSWDASYEIENFPEYAINHYNQNRSDLPKEHPVDIQLSSDNANIDLKLVSELGTQEFSKTCSQKNRYFVESEDELEEGVYRVFINHEGAVQKKDLPLNINLSIKTPQNAYQMKLKIFTADLLNLGHVVDITISSNDESFEINANPDLDRTGLQLIENKYVYTYQGGEDSSGSRNWGTADTGTGSSGGNLGCYVSDKLTYEEGQKLCFGENNNSDGGVYTGTGIGLDNNDSETSSSLVFDVKSTINVSEMGPIGGANYSLSDTVDGIVLYEGKTTFGSSLGSTGIILLPRDVLNTLVDERYYLVKIVGGVDVDRNDDGILDAVATQKKGTLHGLYSGKTLKTDYFKVNILTEVAYQVTKAMLTSETNSSVIESHLNEVAKKLLLPTAKEISYINLVKWMPRIDKKLLKKQYTSNYEPIAVKIYNGEDIYDEAYKLVYEHILLNYSLTYLENSPLDTFSQTLDIGVDNKDVVYALSGEGSELFEISESGVITLVSDVILDYEIKKTYNLSLIATANGFTASSSFIFNIKNILDNPELEDFNTSIKESTARGTVVGTVKYKEGTSPISSFSIFGEGSENFEIDINGTIRVSAIANLDYESVNSFTFNVNAVNDAGTSLTKVVSIKLLDIEDTPVLLSSTISIDENTPVGTVVGYIKIKSDGGSDISKITLKDESSYYFSVSKNGEITLSKYAVLDFETTSSYRLRAVALNLDNEQSVDVTIVININDVREAPIFSDATFSIDENILGGTVLGKLSLIDSLDCPITSIDLESEYLTRYGLKNNFMVNNEGIVSVSLGAVVDYERNSYYIYDVNVLATCGTRSSSLEIYINDLDEDAKIGIGTQSGARVTIYAVEQNGTLSPSYNVYKSSSEIGIFDNHKYTLEAEKYYLYEGARGRELDINYDGVLEDNFSASAGILRAIVKGKWLYDIEMLKVSPLSEMVVRKIEHQAQRFTTASLDARLLEAAQSIVKSDIDGSGSIDVYDSLVYDAKDVLDSYLFVDNLFVTKVISDLEVSSYIGELKIISIHGGTLSSMELFGEGSEYFSLDKEGKITAKDSLSSQKEQTYSFFLKAVDSNGVESVSKVQIRMDKYGMA